MCSIETHFLSYKPKNSTRRKNTKAQLWLRLFFCFNSIGRHDYASTRPDKTMRAAPEAI